MRYYYRAFGLKIESALKLDELIEDRNLESIDVVILIGKVPHIADELYEEGNWFKVDSEGLSFEIEKVAAYYIHGGHEIIIEPYLNKEDPAVRLYLLGTGFGTLLFQRGRLPIHGSGLVMNKQGIIITGESGAGKSTLTSELMRCGCEMLTDDVAAVEIDQENQPRLHPSYPKQKLWADSAGQMDIDLFGLKKIDGIKEKYYIPIKKFHFQSEALKAVFELRITTEPHVYIEEVKGKETLEVLLNHTYRAMLVEPLGLMRKHFIQCAEISNHIKIYRLYRPKDQFTTQQQIKEMEKVLGF